MILNTGNRTDIPAFYSEWFMNRVREGYALVRSPYDPELLLRYAIDPKVVDIIAFCTKDPAPMLEHIPALSRFRQFWYVTITPYGKEIEPGVPDKREVMDSFRALSRLVGPQCTGWRYDPIFLTEQYDIGFHLDAFEKMAVYLSGYTRRIVISFIDLYEKTKRNFSGIREVSREDRLTVGREFAAIARKYGFQLYTCLEGADLAPFGINTNGCMTREVLEEAVGEELVLPAGTVPAREGCRCLLGSDIGVYNTCRHFCRYCYANYDRESVLRNSALHDPASPLLIGQVMPGDTIRDAKQMRYATGQLRLDL